MRKKILLSILMCLACLLMSLTAMAQDSRPRLGLSVTPLQASPLLLQHLRLSEGEGLMVSNIAIGGDLEQNGLSQGDILLAIDGHTLSSPQDLHDYVSTLPRNAKVTLDVIQKGEHRQIYMTLDNLPDELSWKYAQPLSQGSRGMRMPITPGSGSSAQIRIQPNHGGVAQQMTFKSIISTPDGVKSTSVTIRGSKDDPDSEIEMEVGSDQYRCRIGDIDKLPEEARDVARQALNQSNQFSFSFGFGGGDDLMEEMMRRHQEQMRMMDEIFNRQFMGPVQEPQNQSQGSDSVLRPVEPEKDDIRS